MKLKDASFLIRIYSFLMSNNKVQSPLTVLFLFWYLFKTLIGNQIRLMSMYSIPLYIHHYIVMIWYISYWIDLSLDGDFHMLFVIWLINAPINDVIN
jgi:hypothetical protein